MKRPPTELAARLRAVADEVLTGDRAPSVDEMAAATQIPRATLYYYFSGRDELVDFLLLDKIETVGAEVSAAAGGSQDPLTQLEAVLCAVVCTVAAYPTLCTVLLARMATLSPMQTLTVAMETSVLRPLEELLAAGVDAGRFEVEDTGLSAHALYGAVSMAARSRFVRDGCIDADRLADTLRPAAGRLRAPRRLNGGIVPVQGAGWRNTRRLSKQSSTQRRCKPGYRSWGRYFTPASTTRVCRDSKSAASAYTAGSVPAGGPRGVPAR